MVKSLTYGRAGNFYFQVATSIGLALKHGLEFTVNDKTTSALWNPLYLQHLVHPNYNPSLEQVIVKEKHFHYAPIEFDESWRNKNIILDGYWQSERYFAEYRDDILRLFDYPWEHREGVCSIHGRFGDYLEIPGKHIIIDDDYLLRAVKEINERTGVDRFKIFSDDIPRFKMLFDKFGNGRFEYSEGQNEVQDLIDMSSCAHQISSSSTFGWWGGYLNRNPNKVFIVNHRWFQDGWDGADTSDIYSDWVTKI